MTWLLKQREDEFVDFLCGDPAQVHNLQPVRALLLFMYNALWIFFHCSPDTFQLTKLGNILVIQVRRKTILEKKN